jgi:hypothetical protein
MIGPSSSRAALPREMSKQSFFLHFAHTRPIDSDSGLTNGSLKQCRAVIGVLRPDRSSITLDDGARDR